MIPVTPRPEPPEFNNKVRKPGQKFLTQIPNPNSSEWRSKSYWTRVLPDLRRAYDCICAYSATWIPYSVGSHSVDHFIPKHSSPQLAYEWSNFRYVSSRFNSRKGVREILDPFGIQPGWFQINFNNLFIKPSLNISTDIQQEVIDTIKILDLNKDLLVEERITFVQNYYQGNISLEYLRQNAPFISFELERQGLLFL